MKIRCFVDVDGHIWSIDLNGKSKFPGDIEIKDSEVWVLGESDGQGRLIEEEYTLWPSLTDLAMALEQDIKPSENGDVSLEQAVSEAHLNVESFKKSWIKSHEDKPDCYPMFLAKDNAGLWFEQIVDHSQNNE